KPRTSKLVLNKETLRRLRAMMNRQFVILGALVLASACGSNSASSTQVNGQMFGRNFSAQDAISAQQSGSGFSFNGTATYVEITDYAGACGVEGQGQASATGQRLVVAVAQTNASSQSSPPTTTGTFNIFNNSPSPNALVAQAYYEGGCMKQNPSFSQLGTVTVTRVNADGSLEGSFDVNPRSEEHTSELQSLTNLVCRLLLEKKKKNITRIYVECSLEITSAVMYT